MTAAASPETSPRMFASLESIERTVPAALATLEPALGLRSAVLIERRLEGPEVTVWHSAELDARALAPAQQSAWRALEYLAEPTPTERASHTERIHSLPAEPRGAREVYPQREAPCVVVLPLVVHDRRVVGVLQVESIGSVGEATLARLATFACELALALDELHAWDDVRALTDRLDTLALERDRARADAHHARRVHALVAAACETLSASLDYRATVNAVATFALDRFADWCALDVLLPDGSTERLCLVPPLPARDEAIAALSAATPGVIASGRPHVEPTYPSRDLETTREIAPHAPVDALAGPVFHTNMCLPLRAGAHVLGALTLVSLASDPRRAESDVMLASELAGRAARAMDNARLYQESLAAVQRRDELLAVVAHEIRNPLGTIVLAATHALRPGAAEPLSGTLRHSLEFVRSAADRIDRLARDLLDLARLDAARLTLQRRRCDVDAIVAAALDAQALSATVAGITLRRASPSVCAPVFADPDRVAQVLANLLGNAMKFTPRGGVVTLDAKHEGDSVRFTVRDTGKGLAPDELSHVFDRFWQGAHGAALGHGLGLAIVHAIVRAHGGRIWVHSALGRGTTFCFTLPTRDEARGS